MIYFVYLVTLLGALSMFRVKSEAKIGIFLAVSLCFDAVVLPFIPIIKSAKLIVSVCFLLSEWRNLKTLYYESKDSFLNKLTLLSLFAFFLNCFTSPHVWDGEYPFWRLFLSDVVGNIFLPLYVYWSFKDKINLTTVLNIAFIALLVLTFFGAINYITKHSPFMDLLFAHRGDGTNEIGELNAITQRFRVQAMFILGCDYGHICTITSLLFLYGYYNNNIKFTKFFVAMICCIVGVLFCGFRTCVICMLISVISFFVLGFRVKNSVKYISIATIFLLVSYTQIPYVQEQVDTALTAITDKRSEDAGGSSIEMRGAQMLAVLSQIEGHELFGCGRGYFMIDMGWKDGRAGLMVDDLQGLEGKFLSVLLENGYVGIILYLVFILGILVYAYRNRDFNRLSAAYLFSVTSAYLLYSNMTGEQSSAFSSMIAIGLGMKMLDMSINEHKQNSDL